MDLDFAWLAALAIIAPLLVDEFRAWAPSIVDGLIRCAVQLLQEDDRERFSEEWRSHAADVPGNIGKLFVAASFVRGASRMWLDRLLDELSDPYLDPPSTEDATIVFDDTNDMVEITLRDGREFREYYEFPTTSDDALRKLYQRIHTATETVRR